MSEENLTEAEKALTLMLLNYADENFQIILTPKQYAFVEELLSKKAEEDEAKA